MKLNIKGKTALVTGATGGIGAAVSLLLAQKGCNLILTGRNTKALAKVSEDCTQHGVKVYTFIMDMADKSSVDACANDIISKYTTIDLFVLNAGISQRDKVFSTSVDTDELIMNTNYFGTVRFIKKFGSMIAVSGYTAIAVTSSLAGLFGFPLRSSYCASKHALKGFFEAMELEYPNVHVTMLYPGRINTSISSHAVLGDGTKYGKMDKAQAKGMSADRCADIAVRAILRGRHKVLIGKVELLMYYIYLLFPRLFYAIGSKISPV